MNVIGIDIGTTTICALVLDAETGKVLEGKTVLNVSDFKNTNLESTKKFKSLQNVNQIVDKIERLMEELLIKWKTIEAIGITGQMHGILYVDMEGKSISPLYTWQDQRGNEKCQSGETYVEQFQSSTGYRAATGYGLVTHFYNIKNSLVPKQAVKLCTISDYIGMKLTGKTEPVTHITNAASLGGYSHQRKDFDKETLSKLGIDCNILPDVVKKASIIGNTKEGIPVAVAIGDSQASYIGSVKDQETTLLVNIGTGSQVSLYSNQRSEQYSGSRLWESRPFIDQGYILTAASLCGGRAYGALESFFDQVLKMLEIETKGSCYEQMEKWGLEHEVVNPLEISTLFSGTRIDPFQRGSIHNLGLENFTPQHLIHGILEGIVKELFDLYINIHEQQGQRINTLVGSGNAIRKNSILRRKIEDAFDMEICVPYHNEEAAFGAALFGLKALGFTEDQVKALICYQ